MFLVISVCTLHFVVTSVSQHDKMYLDNSLQVQYYLPEDNWIPATVHRLWRLLLERIKLMYRKIIHHILESVYNSRTTGKKTAFVWHM